MSRSPGIDMFMKIIEEATGMSQGQGQGQNQGQRGSSFFSQEPPASESDSSSAYTADTDADSGEGAASGAGQRSPFSAFAGGKKGKRGFGGFGGGGGDDDGGSHLGDEFFEKLGTVGRKALTAFIILALIVLLAAYWWFHPPINIHSIDFWFVAVIFILLPLFLFFKYKSRVYKKGTEKVQVSEGKSKAFNVLSWIPLACFIFGLIGLLMSFSFFPGNAAKYSSILPTQNLDFAQDIQEVNYSEIPVIDRATAEVLGNKEMGTIPDYVSQFEISSLYSQINYKGTPVRVSPLGYADLFKWLTNRVEGIPAYALVDMTTQDAAIVRVSEIDNSVGQGIKYSYSEPLARNIERYVQLSHPFNMFDEFSFEIDESGHPWWICPVQTRTIGLFGGTTIKSVVLCDAVTGEMQDYTLEEVPQWVDRVFPAELLIQQYNWYGAYNNGWLNSWLGQSNVVQTTPGESGNVGYNYIAKDDDVWVYTGVTSATSDNSIVGFVLVNQRTQESHFYSVAGATEESAMASAEGQVQNLRYTATFPILINVANQPTYFMALKDAAGLVKKFAMIDIQRYQNVAVGDTVADCQKSYLTLLATNGVDISAGAASTADTATGKIKNMAQVIIDSTTHYYVTLEGDENIYDCVLPGMLDIVKYAAGDEITLSYVKSGDFCTVDKIL